MFPIHSGLLSDCSCIVLFGNEEIYLEAIARAMIQKYFELPSAPSTTDCEFDSISYRKSAYHFEMDFDASLIKSIVKNRNISGHRHIFVIKRFASDHKQSSLRKVVDAYPNVSFIILCKTTGNIESSMMSRSTLLRAGFDKPRLNAFLKSHYDIDVSPNEDRSLLAILAEAGPPKYETEMYKLMDTIQKSRTQIDIANDIKEYCYKAYHVCIPLSHLCKLVIKRYHRTGKIQDIVKVCAECEHRMVTGTRDILCYEHLFVKLWEILKA